MGRQPPRAQMGCPRCDSAGLSGRSLYEGSLDGMNDLGAISWGLLPSMKIRGVLCFFLGLVGMGETLCQESSREPGSRVVSEDALSENDQQKEGSSESNLPSSPATQPGQYIAFDLLAVEQLILMLSNRSNQDGASHEALVFLGRSPQRGWEAIGLTDVEELRSHWRSVAIRTLAPYVQSDWSPEKKEKIDLAVELSITQFIRLYSNLRADFMQQPDQKARLELLTSDGRYEQLRQLGREGIFKESSLIGKAIHTILANE